MVGAMVSISQDLARSGRHSFGPDCDRSPLVASPRERALYSDLVAIERLFRRSRAYSSKYDVVYQLPPGDSLDSCLVLAIRRHDDGKPVRFASVGIDTTGRCFLTYQAGGQNEAHTEYRSLPTPVMPPAF
jgi:hypothetical protein